MEQKNWDKASKEIVAVAVCNVMFTNLNLKENNLIESRSNKKD
tara:strand:- start:458 stop:586 length:129 start_codon:yes stop_codon:yes gene_type:complete